MTQRVPTVLYLLVLSFCNAAAAQQPAAPPHEVAVRYLVDLVKIDTSNPPGHETQAAQYIKNMLEKEGIPAEVIESEPGRGSVVARLKGNGSKKPLLIMGHLDVVPVERGKWTVDPFAATIKDGYIYGRGASDDKAMDAANLAIFIQLHRLKVPLDRDVIFLAEAGEEGTPQYGIDYLIQHHWDKIAAEFALNEGGGFHLKDGKVEYLGVSSTEKVPRAIHLIARGSSGHGSMPRLDNAIVHLSAAVAKIGSWQAPMRLNETTTEFFKRLAAISPLDKAYLFTHLNKSTVQEKLRATEISYNSMLRTSVSPNVIRGGIKENIIPGEAEAILDVRALPDENPEEFLNTLRRLVNDPAVGIEYLKNAQQRPVTAPSSIKSEAFQALERAQKKVFPGSVTLPLMQTGATDGAELRAKGMQVYGIGVPSAEVDGARIHGNDERMSIQWLGQFVDYEWTAVLDLAAHK